MDRNRDKCLNEVDLHVIMRCASRGFSKLKNTKAPPDSTIRKVLSEALKVRRIRSPDNGEIMLKGLRSFMISNDLPRTYFSNLGNLSVTHDADRLVSQRDSLLRELSVLESEIDILQADDTLAALDAAGYSAERGGDSRFIRLTERVVMKKSFSDTAGASASVSDGT